jgi:hypothetical protein
MKKKNKKLTKYKQILPWGQGLTYIWKGVTEDNHLVRYFGDYKEEK